MVAQGPRRSVARFSLLSMALGAMAGCQAGEVTEPVAMALSDPGALLGDLQGALHLRVFPKGSLRCDTASGQVRDGADVNALARAPGGLVEPALRCGANWNANAARFGTASPVDTCFERLAGTTASIPDPGAYIVLVHGQGNIRLPNNTTRSGILGAGCAEVTVAAGQQQTLTITLREQRPSGTCGDAMLDFDESCDLGPANGGEACSAQCQTPEVTASTSSDGQRRGAALSWGPQQRLVVAWHVENTSAEDVRARYFNAAGETETNFAALRNEVTLAGGASVQSAVHLAPSNVSALRGFAAVWETLSTPTPNVGLNGFNDDAPPSASTTALPAAASNGRNTQPAVAASNDRVMVLYRETDSAGRGVGLRAASTALALRPTAPATAQRVAEGDVQGPAVAARADGRFVAVWSQDGDVFARVVDASGAPQGSAAVRVPAVSTETQDQAVVAAVPGGNEVVVAWRDAARDSADNDGTSIRWARLDANLARIGNVALANATTAGAQSRPALTVAAGSPPTVVLAWVDEPSTSIRARLRRVDDGDVFARLGRSAADFAVSVTRADDRAPAVVVGGEGQVAVAWERSGGPIMVRRFPL
ncbi:MAG: hypothetical protein JNK72_27115 [Myxococcales bacterium]|nr:hypothetical protein [Myxococcales bacterium]